MKAVAMKNSTQQKLLRESTKLTERSPDRNLRSHKIDTSNYNQHDFENLYRTSQNDMSYKVAILKK